MAPQISLHTAPKTMAPITPKRRFILRSPSHEIETVSRCRPCPSKIVDRLAKLLGRLWPENQTGLGSLEPP
ncbi:hypothetical protein ES332_D07G143100v1 [Gossypium tomentosum]|uniref:Uncharacterized protein n=1 Tax=Gossypium tomentosum TaxID=34277 RepID=A0A5D2K7B0_GOSTO|nr:hypothetical protein ES332_D07G143100v1 [Gossypium tomentosum]